MRFSKRSQAVLAFCASASFALILSAQAVGTFSYVDNNLTNSELLSLRHVQAAGQVLGAATPAFVQLKEVNPKVSSNNVSTGNFNSNVTSGNLVVVWFWYNSSSQSVSSVTDTKGNVYLKAIGPTTGTGAMSGWRQELWYAKNIIGGAAFSVTGTFSGTFNAEKAISAHEYSGIDQTSPLDAATAAAASSANASTPTAVITTPNELIFGAALMQGSGSNGSGFTRRSSLANNVTEDKIVTVSGSYAATITNTAQAAVVQMAAFKAAGQTTDTQSPSVPANLSAAAVSSSQINLSWSASTDNVGIAGYKIYRNSSLLTTINSQLTTYQDTGLTQNTLYSYTVSAFDAAGNLSLQSSVASATTQSLPAPVINSFSASPASVTSGQSTTLSWSVSNATAISLDQGIGAVSGTSKIVSPTIPTTYTLTAVNANGSVTAQTTVTVSPDTLAPTVPTGLTAAAVSASSINLGWTASSDNVGVVGYTIYRNGVQVAQVLGSGYQDINLSSGTTYIYNVSAYDAAGNNSNASPAASATTFFVDTQAPTIPANLQTSNLTSSTVTIFWGSSTDNVGVTGYNIYRNGSLLGTVSYPLTTYPDSGLTASTTYSYQVSAFDAAGNVSAKSQPLLVTTPTGPLVAAFPVRYSSNSHYLVDQNNVPFPILGRTAWFVVANTQSDYQLFIDDSVAKGYNTFEMHVLDHDDRGKNPPYAGNGTLPFLKQINGANWDGGLNRTGNTAADFTTPNEAYWIYVDGLLNYAESKGMLVLFFPAYAGYQGGSQGWMQEMVANGPTRVESYGAFLSNRYKNQKNLVWMMGGDQGTFNSSQLAVENSLLVGLKSVTPQQSIYFSAEWDTASPIATDQPNFGSSMSLNGIYEHSSDAIASGRRAYAFVPTEPAFLLEGPYDEEGADGNGWNLQATQPVRRFQWWAWLSSIEGYVLGNGYVWPFSDPNWKTHLNSIGSQDMARLNSFIQSIPWYNLVPSGLNGMKTLVTAGGTDVTAAATPSGSLLVAYIGPDHTGSVTIDMTAMATVTQARWFNPTTATYTTISGSPFQNVGTRTFTPPGNNGSGYADWTLVLTSSVVPDTTAPSVPNNLIASAVSSSQINLSWTASTDDVGVVGYKIYRNGSLLATTNSQLTTYQDTGLAPNTLYSYTVSAYDGAGNNSAQSASVSATTQAPDTISPTVPTNLQSSGVTASSVTIFWNSSTDNVAVNGYQVFNNGTLIGTTAQTSFVVSGLTALTSYTFTVAAYDSSNNFSAQSQGLSVTTTNVLPAIPAFVKLTENRTTVSSNTVATPSFSSAITSGNLIAVWIWYNSNSQSVLSVTDSAGNSYAKAVGPTTGTGSMSAWRQELWYAKNIIGGANVAVTANFSAVFNAEKSITAHEYSGLDTVSPLDATAAAATSTSNSTTGSVTTNFANELIFGGALFQGSGSNGTGFTRRSNIASNVSEDKVVTTIGSYAVTFINTAQSVIGQMVTFKAAGQ